MNYFCDRCGYTSQYAGRFSIHLNKKNTCKPILKDVSIESIKENFLKNHKKKYYCENCGYTTDDKSYFNKHITRKKSCLKITNKLNTIQEPSCNPQFFKKIFDDNFVSNSENVENHINIHIVDSEDQIEHIDFNLLSKKEEYSNNIEELDAIYNQLLKENNISQEENNSELNPPKLGIEPVTHLNEIDSNDNDILEIDTSLKTEDVSDSPFPDYTFTTSYTDIDNNMETDFKEKMEDYFNMKGDINVINKINNIVIHCHTPIIWIFLAMMYILIFPNLNQELMY